MERIEEIKNRQELRKFVTENNPDKDYVFTPKNYEVTDIDTLLSLIETQKKEIERYEKVLSNIEHRSAAYTDRESAKIVLNDIREMAVLARKK